jgi:hypothetical protein
LSWYQSWNTNALRPGLLNWFYLLFVDFNIRQWAALRNDELLATLTWMPQGGRSESLFAAAGSTEASSEALTSLLIHARRTITYPPSLTLDFPTDEMADAIRAAGFTPRRTLLWMRA